MDPPSEKAVEASYSAFEATRWITYRQLPVPRFALMREEATVNDVLTSVEMLLGDYDRAKSAVARYRALLEKMQRGEVTAKEVMDDESDIRVRRVISSFKFVYLAVRAHQDAVCGVLTEFSGRRAGRYTSMSKALKKEDNPVREMLSRDLPEYLEWLPRWKERRDQMKMGAQFAFRFDADDNLSIQFWYPYPEAYPYGANQPLKMIHEEISLDDIVEGLDLSTRIRQVMLSITGADIVIRRPRSSDS